MMKNDKLRYCISM